MNQLDENLLIDTPENITFGYEIAGIGSRFLAALIDTFIIFLLQLLVNFIVIYVALQDVDFSNMQSLTSVSSGWMIALLGLLSFLLLWGYYILFEIFGNGRSPGKAAINLRVIRTDGTPIGLSESVVRNLVRIIDFLPLYYGVGVIAMFLNDQSRRLGDLAAGTLVVREGSAELSLASLAPPVIAPAPAPASGDGQPLVEGQPAYPVEKLTAQDVQMLESFLNRRGELRNRRALALQIAGTLLQRMEIPRDDLTLAEAVGLLEDILRAYNARLRR